MTAPQIIYVMGPSGAGKDTLIQYARRKLGGMHPILFAHRYVTRPAGEDIENYVALTRPEFDQRNGHRLFAFDWEAYGVRYGIGVEIRQWQAAGFAVVVDGSRAHFMRHADTLGDVTPVLVTADADTLRKRLGSRGREDNSAIKRRLERAAAISVTHRSLSTIDNSGPVEVAGDRLTDLLIRHARKG